MPDSQAISHAANGATGSTSGPVKLVIPSKKKVMPAQKNGLSDADFKAITNALGKLVSTAPTHLRMGVQKLRFLDCAFV